MSDQPANLSTDVVVRIIETTPAVVKFNYQEISDHLDSVLANYKGLVFTESTVTECKKTIAELRKGQKSLDEFRKATKKQLTESVTNFEFQCKVLYEKFTAVIKPLTDQQDQFELDRRELKRVEIQAYIPLLVRDQGLDEKYSAQIVILEEYYNKGKTLKEIKKELYAIATSLKVQQDKEGQDIDLVKTKVQLANAQYQLTPPRDLKPEPYLRLLNTYPISRIEESITFDAQEAKKTYDAFDALEDAKVAVVPEVVDAAIPVPVEIPNAGNSVPSADPVVITMLYRITGTVEQLTGLEQHLGESYLIWVGMPDEDPDDDDFMN